MKKNFLFVLLAFVLSQPFCNAETQSDNTFKTRLNLNDNSPKSVAERANRTYGDSATGGGIQDPLMNGMMNGYYNMMQGASGNYYNNIHEMQKQQTDYVKQQMSNQTSEGK